MVPSRLYRHRTDRKLGGVCAGIADYLDVDPTWIRLGFAIFALMSGLGVVLYLLLWVIVPEQGRESMSAAETVQEGVAEIAEHTRRAVGELRSVTRSPLRAQQMAGIVLLVLGLAFLARTLAWWRWIDFDLLWPLLLIGGGMVLLFWRNGRYR